jgi:hypothetical protein
MRAKYFLAAGMVCVILCGQCPAPAESPEGSKTGSQSDARAAASTSPFFNGKDLNGWEGLPGVWRVDSGSIIGSAPGGSQAHTFLCNQQPYKNFDLKFQVRLGKSAVKSAVQFRSRLADRDKFIVAGPQCVIRVKNQSNPYSAGSLRTEPGNQPDDTTRAAKFSRVFKDHDFNRFEIHCQDKHVVIKVNGYTMVNRDFPTLAEDGIIAWELETSSSQEVVFKKIEFTDLSRAKAGKDDEHFQDDALLKAEATYTAAVHKADEELLRQFDNELKRLAKRKSPETASALIVLQQQKDAFQAKGLFPLCEAMRDPLQRYLKATNTAHEALAKQFTQAIKRCEKQGSKKGLEDLGELAESLLAPHIVAVWQRPNHQKTQFLSDGTLTNPTDKNESHVGYWSLEGNRLLVVIPDGKKEDSYESRECLLAPDGKRLQCHDSKNKVVEWHAVDEVTD